MIRVALVLALLTLALFLLVRLIRLSVPSQARPMRTDQEIKETAPEDAFREKDLLELSADRQSLEGKIRSLRDLGDRLMKLLEHGSAAGSSDDMISMLAGAIEVAREYLGLDDLRLLLFDEAGLPMEIEPGILLSSNFLRRLEETSPPMSRFMEIVESGDKVGNATYVTDLGIMPELNIQDTSGTLDAGEDESARVLVSFVGRNDHIIGLLVGADSKRISTAEEQAGVLESIAAHAVGTIRNVRVYHELHDRVDDLKTTKTKLEELSAIKSSIVSTASHELKTPLASIRAYVRTLERNIGSEDIEVQKQFLKVIDEESERLMRIVEEILSLSRLESGRIRIELDETDLGAIIDETCELLEPSANEKDIELVCRVEEDLAPIEADPDLIRQLIMNLVSNAVKFTGQSGTVTISLWEERSCTKITVKDTGIGIPQGDLDRIFEEFYQVNSTAAAQHSGSGLGLAICNDIVRWHEGRIWVDSKEHVGTTFTVALPKRHSFGGRTGRMIRRELRDPEDEHLVSLMVEMIGEVLSSDKVCLLLMSSYLGVLSVEAGLGVNIEAVQKLQIKPGQGLAGECFESGKAVVVSSSEHVGYGSLVDFFGESVSSGLVVPVISAGRKLGVILAARTAGDVLQGDDLGLAEAIAERVSNILGRLTEYRDQKNLLAKAREAIRSVVDTRRYYSGGKTGRLAKLAAKVGTGLGVPDESLPALSYAATIYDVGMVSVRDDILRKAGMLSESEVKTIRLHSERGLELVEPLESSRDVKDAILYHHERFDGAGYPSGLAGSRIPLFARIISVVDAFESMVLERPHREALTYASAIDELRKHSGGQFDPAVVDALLAVVSEEQD